MGRRIRTRARRGYTLIELAIVIGVIGILAAAAFTVIRNPESRDADLLMAAHASLQNIVSQASTRQDRPPSYIMSTMNATTVNALNDTLSRNNSELSVTGGGGSVRVTINSTGRWANFQVVNGKVNMTATGGGTGFTQYSIGADGNLRHN